MVSDKRFAGTIGEDYDLFKLAVPHHDEFQDKVGEIIREFAGKHPELDEIVVLEVGCGHGETTRRILDADPRVRVIAVDTDSHMLSVARNSPTLGKYWRRTQFELSLSPAFKQYRKRINIVASAYTLHNFLPAQQYKVRYEISRCFEENCSLFVNADKYARTNILDHWSDLKNQIDAFSVFDDIGRPDLRLLWTEHYLNDEKTRTTERKELSSYQWSECSSKEFVYRKGMEAVFCARRG